MDVGAAIWRCFMDTFDFLPVAAVINSRVCVSFFPKWGCVCVCV